MPTRLPAEYGTAQAGRMKVMPEAVPMEAKLKHLELIQGVINRLATNSFRIKGWAVVLVSAVLVLLARKESIGFVYVGFVPVLVFWGLDGYFLWQERLFRDLYDHVRSLEGRRRSHQARGLPAR